MPIAINGSGTITGISAGGLPDGVITSDDLASSAFATTAQKDGTHTTGSITSGTTALTVASGSGISNGDYVIGEGITPGTTVSSGGGTTSITLSANANTTLSSDPVSFYSATKLLSPGLIGGQLCKAWVNFNGTSTVSIRASYNVSSITDNGTGDYTVNFTTALADANYSVAAMGQRGDGAAFGNYGFFAIQGTSSNTLSPTASSIRLNTMSSAGSALDYPAVFVSIFR
jgi:hypothetical protein